MPPSELKDQFEYVMSIEDETLNSLQEVHGENAVRDGETCLETSMVEDSIIVGALTMYHNEMMQSGNVLVSTASMILLSRFIEASKVDEDQWMDIQAQTSDAIIQAIMGGPSKSTHPF